VPDPDRVLFDGSRDVRDGWVPLPRRFRRHADALARSGRSPLCIALMRSGADDIDAGGLVGELFEGVPTPPGSVPQLRLVAALHYLVLSGNAPELARFYPSVGGDRPPDGVWPVAHAALDEHAELVRGRLQRTVQTNDPGRSTVLYAALLWLTDRYGLPIRLLELGASAGLNLFADRYCYLVNGDVLGDPASPVRFKEPWDRAPDLDLVATAERLRVIDRAGCDRSPLDAGDPEDRLTLLSYIWPDELERFARTKAAFEVAVERPGVVAAADAEAWLRAVLAPIDGALVVVWHSLFRQYIPGPEWESLEATYRDAIIGSRPDAPVVWLSMEPEPDHNHGVQLTVRTTPPESAQALARCGDHGPPLIWN
jgi:hypothetical protein